MLFLVAVFQLISKSLVFSYKPFRQYRSAYRRPVLNGTVVLYATAGLD
jgi:hypothetical protein